MGCKATGQSGEGRQARERSSFLKKRSKKRLFPRSARRRAPNKQKFFGSFFQKRTAFFLQPIALCTTLGVVRNRASSVGGPAAGLGPRPR
jgi:hypothetical protein